MTQTPVSMVHTAYHVVRHLHFSQPTGTMLVFFPGEYEIVQLQEMITKRLVPTQKDGDMPIRVLIATSSDRSQVEHIGALSERYSRTIVLASAVLQQSLTIPYTIWVIDCGLEKDHGSRGNGTYSNVGYDVGICFNQWPEKWKGRSDGRR